jgi:hypothetical protein
MTTAVRRGIQLSTSMTTGSLRGDHRNEAGHINDRPDHQVGIIAETATIMPMTPAMWSMTS